MGLLGCGCVRVGSPLLQRPATARRLAGGHEDERRRCAYGPAAANLPTASPGSAARQSQARPPAPHRRKHDTEADKEEGAPRRGSYGDAAGSCGSQRATGNQLHPWRLSPVMICPLVHGDRSKYAGVCGAVGLGTFQGERCCAALERSGSNCGGIPARIRVEDETEPTSKALTHCIHWNQMEPDFSRPERAPRERPIESLNDTTPRECSYQHYFVSLEEAQRTPRGLLEEHNNTSTHPSSANHESAVQRARGCHVPACNRVDNVQLRSIQIGQPT